MAGAPARRAHPADSGDPVRTVLLVSEGKLGAADRVRLFDGRTVRVTGTVLHRDGRRMLELGGDGAIEPIAMSEEQARVLRRPEPRDLGAVTLTGEIIDLITGADGGPLGEDLLPFVGVPARISGRVREFDDLLVLQLAPGNIRRR